MTYQCPYTPLELAALNPHALAYGSRVVLPDGRTGMVSKHGYKHCYVDADHGADWRGYLADLRPATAQEIGQPRLQQLALF
jgi:hypothetical protein